MERARLIRALGLPEGVSEKIESEVDVFGLLRQGLPYETFEVLIKQKRITLPEMGKFIPTRTLARRKKERKFNLSESDKLTRLALILDFAEEVFGDHEKARTWLRRPNRSLNSMCPLEMLETDYGARIVENVLGRIAHGVYS